MDKIKEIIIENWFLALVFLGIALILLVVVIILAVKVKKQARLIEKERAERAEEPQRTTALLEETVESAATDERPVEDDDDTLEVIEREDNKIEVKDKSGEGYVVAYDSAKGDWTIRKKGAERATRRVATKEEAMKIAKELSRKHNVALIVKKKDGRFQKHY